MKIKKSRLQQIIREELTRVLREQVGNDMDANNYGMGLADKREAEIEDIKDDLDRVDFVDVETGEVLYIGAGTQRGIPAAKADEFIEKLSLSVRGDDKDGTERSIELSSDDLRKLEGHIDDVYDQPEREKQRAADQVDQERLEPENLKARLRDWAKIAGEEWEADNRGASLEDVAMDLAAAAEHSFESDEWEELLYHFDNNEYHLNLYTAESM